MIHTKVLIIGSGPAGYTAAIYTSRANLETTIIGGSQLGGQLTMTTDVENYPGFIEPIQGPWLVEQMKSQTERYGTKIIQEDVIEVDCSKKPFICKTASEIYTSNAVIIATGAQARWLNIESESYFKGYGVSGCATCDGFFYKNKPVVVVGGGNTAVEEALHLAKTSSKVYLIHRGDKLRCEEIIQNRLLKNDKIETIFNTQIDEILGEKGAIKYVKSVRLLNNKSNQTQELAVDGVFIAIGHKPSTDLFKGQISIDEHGYIITEKGSTKTNIAGVFAAGDVQDKHYRQAITAAGSGCMAAIDVQNFFSDEN